MKLFRVRAWSHGQWHYCADLEPPQFVPRRGAGRLFTRKQATEVRRRFSRVKLKLALEEVPPQTQLQFSEMVRE